jgi:hypothetical protein
LLRKTWRGHAAYVLEGKNLNNDFPVVARLNGENPLSSEANLVRTARRIQTVHRQRGVRHCRFAVGFGSRCLGLVWKRESLELATPWNQHFAHSTHNIWPDNTRRVSQMKAGQPVSERIV